MFKFNNKNTSTTSALFILKLGRHELQNFYATTWTSYDLQCSFDLGYLSTQIVRKINICRISAEIYIALNRDHIAFKSF